ncbi:MAG: peptide chain release factor N(5)-glutamine methyltransferase [Mariprofundaceae bacterium]
MPKPADRGARPETAREILLDAVRRLRAAGCDSPRLDAELLLGHAWNKSRTALIADANEPPPEAVRQRFERLLERRRMRQPMAQILGAREFFSRTFLVTPDVLAPRPETEHLIEAAFACFPDRRAPLAALDLCTGSGCLAVTLACEYPAAHVIATDISAPALEVARRNAARCGVEARVTFREGDLWAALEPNDGPFELILANPPYIALDEMDELDPELAFEPRIALTDEADGLTVSRRILAEAPAHLRDGGVLVLETGPCGLPETPPHLARQLDGPEPVHDLAGRLRGGIWRRHARC